MSKSPRREVMSQKRDKSIRKAALKYAIREEKRIAKYQMEQLYNLPFGYRILAALGIIFKWGRKKA